MIARERHRSGRRKGIPDKRIGDQSALETDLEGIAGEIVVAKALNLFPDFEIDHQPAADLLTHDGRWIDVKATVYTSGRLLAAPWKTEDGVDWFVLVIGRFPEYRIAGAMPAGRLLRPERLKDLGRGPGYAVDQAELVPFDQAFDVPVISPPA